MAVFAAQPSGQCRTARQGQRLELLARKCYLGSTLNMRADDDNDLTETS